MKNHWRHPSHLMRIMGKAVMIEEKMKHSITIGSFPGAGIRPGGESMKNHWRHRSHLMRIMGKAVMIEEKMKHSITNRIFSSKRLTQSNDHGRSFRKGHGDCEGEERFFFHLKRRKRNIAIVIEEIFFHDGWENRGLFA